MSNIPDIKQVLDFLTQLQQNLQNQLSNIDGKASFVDDNWKRPDDTGHGISSVLRDGAVFEQAGVNFSYIKGDSLPPAATAKRPELAGRHYEATGVSLVIHPRNPYVPTTHMNVRFFIAYHKTEEPIWWFGGGYDLTPYYGFDEDCTHWHQTAFDACAPSGEGVYQQLKAWCDRYFYLPHRDEPRGIGGIFYDDWNEPDFDAAFAHTKRVGESFAEAYLPIVKRRKDTAYGDRERQFQLYRRGRYVEFNLLFDRGTLFGIQSKGRTESILMSMPPTVRWEYGFTPAADSDEETLYSRYLTSKDWVK